MSLTFFDFDTADRTLTEAPGSVQTYPGGDICVRGLHRTSDAGVPVCWSSGGTIDYPAVAQWAAFHAAYYATPVLVVPYLPSARGDHDPTFDAQTAARLTAATGVSHVIATDPHSPAWADAAEVWGTRVHAISAATIISESHLADTAQWTAVIAPDKGARTRAGQVADALSVPLLTAGKVRDPATGALSGFTPPVGLTPGRFLIVDDICDGGGTFAGLAQQIHRVTSNAELHLFVTHGLFTGRWRENLLPNFWSITAANTTGNNHDAPLPEEVLQIPVRPHVIDVLARLHPAATRTRRTRKDRS